MRGDGFDGIRVGFLDRMVGWDLVFQDVLWQLEGNVLSLFLVHVGLLIFK